MNLYNFACSCVSASHVSVLVVSLFFSDSA